MKQKIYILFCAFLVAFMVICQPISAYCATNIDNWRKDVSDYRWAYPHETALTIYMPDGSTVDFDLQVEIHGGGLQLYYRPNNATTYLGDISFNSLDLMALQPSIILNLPVAKYDSNGKLYYDLSHWESASWIVNNPYNKDNATTNTFLFGTSWDSFGGCQTRPYDNSTTDLSKCYSSFMVKNITSYVHPNGIVFTGTYEDVFNNYSPYDYICYTLQTLRYLLENMTVSEILSHDVFKIQKIYADGFSHLNTEEYKLYQETLKNAIDKGTEDIENKLDDMNNMGDGQFDNTKNEVNDLTNNIDKNQAILDKVDRVDPDIAGDDLNAIIDNILSDQESVNAFNSILRLFTTNTWFISFMSIAVCTGVIKYIFFGKG